MNIKKVWNIITRILFAIIGFLAGFFAFQFLVDRQILKFSNQNLGLGIKVFVSIITALILLSFSEKIISSLRRVLMEIEKEISKRPLSQIVITSIGLIIGLIIASLISQLINGFNIGFIGSILSLLVYIGLGYIGVMLPSRNSDSISNFFKTKIPQLMQNNSKNDKNKNLQQFIVDTSAIIDGRILEISKTGFIDGVLVIPIFVLEELQHIADSSDPVKRNRGRRGLEVVDKLQNVNKVDVVIETKNYEEILEVDSKLVKMAIDQNSKLMTNDFNLNKVATVQGIEVLNINELANALKPVAIPGEKMFINIIKEGQEENQGVGYLDDGTMIVVENGKEYIGQSREVIVTSVLQTNAGKMIFAK